MYNVVAVVVWFEYLLLASLVLDTPKSAIFTALILLGKINQHVLRFKTPMRHALGVNIYTSPLLQFEASKKQH